MARTVDELEDGLSLLEFAALEFVPVLEFSVEKLKSGLLLESEPQATRFPGLRVRTGLRWTNGRTWRSAGVRLNRRCST